MSWTLVIHGGAARILRERTSRILEAQIRGALERALDAGASVLSGGGGALEAVEAAIRVLEDAAQFNAGHGAALTADGVAELDAAIMEGGTRAAGAVAGVTRTRHPISLARAVMGSRHVFLAGKGADDFSLAQGLEQAEPDWFITTERRAHLDEMHRRGGAFDTEMKYGTVGAVARDRYGHVAAGTSTGGVTGKNWGRIGDSPVIGAGTWADDRGCAVSCTGAGEYFLRVGVAQAIDARVRLVGESIEQASDAVLAEVTAMGGAGGVIVAGADGSATWRFTTPGMHRATVTGMGQRRIAMFGDES